MPKIEIALCEDQTIKEITEHNWQVFNEMYEKEPYSFDKYKERIGKEIPIILIAKENNQIIGDMIIFERSNELYLWILAVNKKHRKKGIASSFLKELISIARQKNKTKINTKVYHVSKEMQKFLLKNNFSIKDRREDYSIFELNL